MAPAEDRNECDGTVSDNDSIIEDEDSYGTSENEFLSEEEEEESEEEEEAGIVEPEAVHAEKEIEGDFDRLIQNIRSRDTSDGAGVLARDWDFNIEEREAEFRDDLREASGVGRRRRRKKGRQAGPVLSQQVRALIGEGNQAYVDSDIPEAVRIMQEVIRIEPRAVAAWSVLAQCYADMGQDQKALQLRIMAAHLRHDADEWDRLARQSRELGFNQQALYCYRKVYSLDPTNADALWDRASLAKEIGDLKTARNSFLSILKRFPHDLTVLSELRPILIELSELPTCVTLFQDAFEHYHKSYPSGRGVDVANNVEIIGGGFGLMEILVLADIYNTLGDYDRAVDAIRKGCRWLQGRAEQKYWDLCADDREYDLLDFPPRVVTGEDGYIEPGRFPLDINARHRLAVARIKMGDIEEGKTHANVVLSQDVLDYAPLFTEIADAYFEREMYADARPIYELLGADEVTSSLYVLLQTAACLRMLDELKEAAEVYEHVRLADPTNNDAKMKLAEIYEILNEPRKALELVYEVIDSRKKRGKEPSAMQREGSTLTSTSLFEERAAGKGKVTSKAQQRLTHAQLRELEAEREKEVMRGYRRVQELWPRMLAGEEDAVRVWLLEAEKLVDTFRETRNLFLTSRTNPFRGMFPRSRARKNQQTNEDDEDRMASRLHLEMAEHDVLAKRAPKGAVDVFRGVNFNDWLRLFMQYAFLLTSRGQYEVADEVLRHLLVSNAFQSRERQDSIRLALITCALAIGRPSVVVEHARKLITAHQFNNEPQRVLLAALSSGLRETDAFITSTLQKHLFRELKLADTAFKSPEVLKWNSLNKRYAPSAQIKSADVEELGDEEAETSEHVSSGEKEQTEIPKKPNPIIVAIYGQICIAAKSYQSAIFYLLHAYDYCPEDPMICLCLAIASIGRAMQRQSDNRHHLIAQAMAFLSQYRQLRMHDPQGVAEVEFNFGRAFHQLSLYSHAARHYERVLEMADKSTTEGNNFAREAAYNLSLIYVLTGATPLADAIYRRWLSI